MSKVRSLLYIRPLYLRLGDDNKVVHQQTAIKTKWAGTVGSMLPGCAALSRVEHAPLR